MSDADLQKEIDKIEPDLQHHLIQIGYREAGKHNTSSPDTIKRIEDLKDMVTDSLNKHSESNAIEFKGISDTLMSIQKDIKANHDMLEPMAEDYRALIKMGKWIGGIVAFVAILVGIWKSLWR